MHRGCVVVVVIEACSFSLGRSLAKSCAFLSLSFRLSSVTLSYQIRVTSLAAHESLTGPWDTTAHCINKESVLQCVSQRETQRVFCIVCCTKKQFFNMCLENNFPEQTACPV